MFFVASKVLWVLASPANLLLIGAFVGALRARRSSFGRALALSCILALVAAGTLPLGALLIRPLEQRFPAPPADLAPPYGIIVLGGAIDDAVSQARGQVALQDGASRLTEAAILARRFPDARVVYTGGSASLTHPDSNEADEARNLLIALGVDPQRIAIETRSRNTDENARFTAAIVDPKPDQNWLLVTSAYHMPRSMGLFEKAGFFVRAFPVDYHTFGDARDFELGADPILGLKLLDLAAHEWVGLAAYRAAGKIDEWFPGP